MSEAVAYRAVATRSARTTSNVLHITEVARGKRWLESRNGRSLCAVPVALFPEPDGPEAATCRRCIQRYRKITEAGNE